MSILTFIIGQQRYGFRITDVREVVPIAALVSLAGAPGFLKGLLALRDVYIPVLDGRTLLGEPPYWSLESQIVIVGDSLPQLGLLVDEVEDVYTIDRPALALDSTSAAPFLQSVVPAANRPVLLFDCAALLELVPSFSQRTAITPAVQP